jgi:hypothetical protein
LAGAYTIEVAGLPAGWRVRRVMRNGAPVADGTIVVLAGEAITGVEIVIGMGST